MSMIISVLISGVGKEDKGRTLNIKKSKRNSHLGYKLSETIFEQRKLLSNLKNLSKLYLKRKEHKDHFTDWVTLR